jgi:hypothetical protein
MNSEWEAVRGFFNAARAAARKPLLSVDEVKSMLENKGGNMWAVKRDVFEEKEMFTGGWKPEGGKFTVGGMVAGNAAKELPPAVRVIFPQSGAEWYKLMPMLKVFPGFTEQLGGGHIPAYKLRCVYHALRANDVQVENDDDCSILWSKVVSTATGREVDAEEAQKMLTKDYKAAPYKIAANADKGDVAAVKELLARVLKRAEELVLKDKGKGNGKATEEPGTQGHAGLSSGRKGEAVEPARIVHEHALPSDVIRQVAVEQVEEVRIVWHLAAIAHMRPVGRPDGAMGCCLIEGARKGDRVGKGRGLAGEAVAVAQHHPEVLIAQQVEHEGIARLVLALAEIHAAHVVDHHRYAAGHEVGHMLDDLVVFPMDLDMPAQRLHALDRALIGFR